MRALIYYVVALLATLSVAKGRSVSSTEEPTTLHDVDVECGIRTLMCLVNHFKVDNTIVMTFLTANKLEEALNWMLELHHLGLHNYVLVALDMEAFAALSAIGAPVFLGETEVGMWKHDKKTEEATKPNPDWVWLVRYEYVLHVLESGVNVIQSDLDAHWLRNALTLTAGVEDDMMLSRASGFPPAISKVYSSVACLGFSFLRATANCIRKQKEVLRELKSHFHDGHSLMDQSSFNKVLFEGLPEQDIPVFGVDHFRTTHDSVKWGLYSQMNILRDAKRVADEGISNKKWDLYVLHVKVKMTEVPWQALPESTRSLSTKQIPLGSRKKLGDHCPECSDGHCRECLLCAGIWFLRKDWEVVIQKLGGSFENNLDDLTRILGGGSDDDDGSLGDDDVADGDDDDQDDDDDDDDDGDDDNTRRRNRSNDDDDDVNMRKRIKMRVRKVAKKYGV